MKTKSSGKAYLDIQVKQLEEKEAQQTLALRQHITSVLQNLSPSSLLKNAVREMITSKKLQQHIIDTSAGIGAGLLARKLFAGSSKNIVTKFAGTLLQNITAGIISQKMPGIREKISNFYSR